MAKTVAVMAGSWVEQPCARGATEQLDNNGRASAEEPPVTAESVVAAPVLKTSKRSRLFGPAAFRPIQLAAEEAALRLGIGQRVGMRVTERRKVTKLRAPSDTHCTTDLTRVIAEEQKRRATGPFLTHEQERRVR